MSTVGKELHLVVLDVGPHMHPYLGEATRNLFNLATARVLNKPTLEMAVIFFGTTETDNDLNREFAAAGDEGQYTNIVTARELACVTADTMRALRDAPRGGGPSDWVNALLLAIDLMKKADAKFKLDKWPRKIFLISTFTQAVDVDSETLEVISRGLQASKLQLEAFVAGAPEADAPAAAEARDGALSALDTVLSAAPGALHFAPRPGDVAGMLQAVYKDGSAAYSGPFTIIDQHINVKIYKKVNPEPVVYNCSAWELKRYVRPRTEQADEDCWVEHSREYRVVNDLETTVVALDKVVPAYKYGKDYIPVPEEDEMNLMYHPEKGMALLGFVDAEGDGAVPRYYLGCNTTKGCFVVLGEKEADAVAISALARAMARDKKAGVARVVFRARTGTPGLYLLTPLLAPPRADERPGARQVDCLVLNKLPFADDFRSVRLPSFALRSDRPDLTPSAQQAAAMADLVRGLDLMGAGPLGREALRPEDVISPVQQRFYHLVGMRALDPDYKFPPDEGEALTAATCDPPFDGFGAAGRAAADKLKSLFKTQAPKPKPAEAAAAAAAAAAQAGAAAAAEGDAAARAGVFQLGEGGARVVRGVGPAAPLEDFASLLEGSRLDEAFSGMTDVVPRLVEDSVGGRLYGRAVACMAALREAAVKHARPAAYNGLLTKLMEQFESDPIHGSFVRQLLENGAQPVSTAEVPAGAEGAVTPAEAEAFSNRGRKPVLVPAGAAAAEEEEDEFAGME